METAFIKCPTCGADFPAGARFCPKCGYVVPATVPVAEPPPPAQPTTVYVEQPAAESTSWAPWLTLIVIVVLVAGGLTAWNMGYLGGASSTTVVTSGQPNPPQHITINNPPTPPANPPQNINITTQQPPPAVLPPSTKPEIVSVRAEALEQGPDEWKEGYEAKLRNTSNVDVKVGLKIQFLDGSGYVVDDTLANDLVIPANSVKSFSGSAMIKADVASTIKSVKATFR